MATTFNPNNYSRSQIEDALKGGMDYYGDKSGIDTALSAMETSINDIGYTLTATGNELTRHEESSADTFNYIIRKIAAIQDLFDQVIYKGSNNRLDLSSATITEVSSDITATLSNGVLTVRKPSVTQADCSIVISGVKIEAGEYYICTGDDLDSEDQIFSMTIKDHSGEAIHYPVYNNDDDMSIHYAEFPSMQSGETDTTGSIVIYINKDYYNHVYFHIIPTCAITPYDKSFSSPRFPSLMEV